MHIKTGRQKKNACILLSITVFMYLENPNQRDETKWNRAAWLNIQAGCLRDESKGNRAAWLNIQAGCLRDEAKRNRAAWLNI